MTAKRKAALLGIVFVFIAAMVLLYPSDYRHLDRFVKKVTT